MRKFVIPLAVAISTCAPAFAVTVHNTVATARCGGITDSKIDTLAPSGTTNGAGASQDNCGASALAQTGGGTVRVRASLSNTAKDDLTLTYGSASAGAWIRYDLVMKTLVTQTNPVPFSVNLHAAGSVNATSNQYISDTGQYLNSGQVISAGLRAFGSISGNGQVKTFEERASVRVNPGESESDFLGGDFTTPTIMVSGGDLISISFGLDAGTSGQLLGTTANGLVNAINSLSFATSGDVFNLAPGYFVEIDEARIINNRYTPPPPLLVSAVPLPAGGFALLLALGGLAALRRKR